MMVEPEIREALRGRFATTPPIPDMVLHEVLQRIPELPQQRLETPLGPRWGSETAFRVSRFMAAGTVVALLGGLLLVGLTPRQPDDPVRPAVAVSATASARAPSTMIPAPRAEALPADRVAGDGPVLTWKPVDLPFLPAPRPGAYMRVFHYDGRYLMEASGPDTGERYYDSQDGITWAPLQPDAIEQAVLGGALVRPFGGGVAVHQDRSLRFYGPDGGLLPTCPSGQDLVDGCRGRAFMNGFDEVAISPAGILVIAPAASEQVISDVLGPEVAQGEWRFLNERIRQWDRRHPRSRDQTWFVKTGDGQVHRIVLPDHGYVGSGVEGQPVRAALGWFSPDGVEWTPLHRSTEWFGDLIGTDDGFWSKAGKWRKRLLYSPDGLHWTTVAEDFGGEEYQLAPGSRLLIRAGKGPGQDLPPRLLAVSTDEVTELPLSRGARRALEPDPTWTDLATSSLGIVALDDDHHLSLYSADGSSWGIATLPAEWSLAEPYDYMDSFVAGDGEVLVVRRHCSSPELTREKCGVRNAFFGTEPDISTLWQGTLVEPADDD